MKTSTPERQWPSFTALAAGLLGIICTFLGVLNLLTSKNLLAENTAFVEFGFGIWMIVASRALGLIKKVEFNTRKAEAAAELPTRGEALFWYFDGERIAGPVVLSALKSMRALPAENRPITGETMICMEGSEVWARLADIST